MGRASQFALAAALVVGCFASNPPLASAACDVAFVWPTANQQLADCSASGAQYRFDVDKTTGTFAWSVSPTNMGTFSGQGSWTLYTPARAGAATITLTRTCSSAPGDSKTITQSVRQYTIAVAAYANGGYLVGRSRVNEVQVTATGPDAGPVPVTFRRYRFGAGDVGFRDPQTSAYLPEVIVQVPANSSYADLDIKGSSTSSFVQDVEFDGRVVMADNLFQGGDPNHPIEGIGVTRNYTVATCDTKVEGVDDAAEYTTGVFVAVNNNDSDGNGVTDREPTETNLASPDPELKKYTVEKLQPNDLTGVFESKLVGVGGAGAIRLWEAATKTGTPYVNGDPYPQDAVNAGLGKDRWIEGVAAGSGARGIVIEGYLVGQGYTKGGSHTVEDLVAITVFGVEVTAEEVDLNAEKTIFDRGLTVVANRDEDDGDTVVDYLNNTSPTESEATENDVEDDELYELKLKAKFPLSASEITVTLPQGWEAFDDRKKTTKLTTIPGALDASGTSIFLEAKDLSATLKDVEITIDLLLGGTSLQMKIPATVGLICGPQYVTQLSRFRYEVLFPQAEGNPTASVTQGTTASVPNEARQLEVTYGSIPFATQNTIKFSFSSGRTLAWKIDVFKVSIEDGVETAGQAPLEAGSAPICVGVSGFASDYHEHQMSSVAPPDSMTMRYDFTAVSPRSSKNSPGGRYISLGLVQSIKMTELQSTFRASQNGDVPVDTILFNETIVTGTKDWWWDSLHNNNIYYDDSDAHHTLEADGTGSIGGSGRTGDTPVVSVPFLCERTVAPPDPWYGVGAMSANPTAADPAPNDMGSISSTSVIIDFRVWVASSTVMGAMHADDHVNSWNVDRYWAITKAYWRTRTQGTNADAGFPWAFTAGTAGHGNGCSETEASPPTDAMAKWTQLTSPTPPTTLLGDNYNAEWAPKLGNLHWDPK